MRLTTHHIYCEMTLYLKDTGCKNIHFWNQKAQAKEFREMHSAGLGRVKLFLQF